MELEITWKRAAKVWWAFFWRDLVWCLIHLIISGLILIGFFLFFGLINFINMNYFNITDEFSKEIIGIFLVCGYLLYQLTFYLISIVPMKMILGKDFGEFRLLLVKTTHAKEIKVPKNEIRYF